MNKVRGSLPPASGAEAGTGGKRDRAGGGLGRGGERSRPGRPWWGAAAAAGGREVRAAALRRGDPRGRGWALEAGWGLRRLWAPPRDLRVQWLGRGNLRRLRKAGRLSTTHYYYRRDGLQCWQRGALSEGRLRAAPGCRREPPALTACGPPGITARALVGVRPTCRGWSAPSLHHSSVVWEVLRGWCPLALPWTPPLTPFQHLSKQHGPPRS